MDIGVSLSGSGYQVVDIGVYISDSRYRNFLYQVVDIGVSISNSGYRRLYIR